MKTGQISETAGQADGTSSRAHAPYSVGGCPNVPRDTDAGRDTVAAGQDIGPVGTNVPSRRQQGGSSKRNPMSALHVAALNTLQDFETGVIVPAHRLEAACRLLGRPIPAPARVSTPEAA